MVRLATSRGCVKWPPKIDTPCRAREVHYKEQNSHTVDPIARTGEIDLEELIKHKGTSANAIELELYIEGKLVNMELNTEASVLLISEAT